MAFLTFSFLKSVKGLAFAQWLFNKIVHPGGDSWDNDSGVLWTLGPLDPRGPFAADAADGASDFAGSSS